jgi:hypothetical protein
MTAGAAAQTRCLAVTSMPSPDGWRISSLGQPQAKGGYIDCFHSSMPISASAATVRYAAITTAASKADGWRLEQPEPGVLVWHTPAGRTYTTTPTRYPA